MAPINDDGELMLDRFEDLLSERTRLVSVTWVSNALGTVNPVRDIIELAHGRGLPVLLDAAQAVQHMPVDVRDLDCEFLVFSGHKLYGPSGIGVLYGKAGLLEAMPPYQGGGEMIASVSYAHTEFNEIPYKFEAGTPAIEAAVGLAAAIDYVECARSRQHRRARSRAARPWHPQPAADPGPAPGRHRARQVQRSGVRHGRRASPGHRHAAGSRRHCRPHRPSLRAADDRASGLQRDRPRLDRAVQQRGGPRRPGHESAPHRVEVRMRGAVSDQARLDNATEFLSADAADKDRQAEIDQLSERVIEALRTVYDPEIPVNIFELGLVYKIDIDDRNDVHIDMTLTSPMCPVAETLPEEVKSKVEAIDGVGAAEVNVVWDPPWNPSMMTEEAQLELGILLLPAGRRLPLAHFGRRSPRLVSCLISSSSCSASGTRCSGCRRCGGAVTHRQSRAAGEVAFQRQRVGVPRARGRGA